MLPGPEDPRPHRRPSAYGVALVALVSVQAFVSFLDGNASQITQSTRVVVYAIVTTAVFVGLLALAVRWSKGDRDQMAVAVAGVAASFLNFSLLFDADPADDRKAIAVGVLWLLLTAVAARLLYLVGGNANVRFALMIFVAMTVLLPTVSYVSYRTSDHDIEPVADPGPLDLPATRPNVYWMLLDGYARPDQLERVSGFDDSDFVTDLSDRGFQVSASSYTSYPRTHFSVSSTLDMRYPLEPGDDVTDEFATFAPVVQGNSITAARFEALGYQTAYGTAGGLDWSKCDDDLVDVCLPINRPSPSTGELEQTLLNRTPLGVVPLPVPYADPVSFADALVDPEVGMTEPFFAFQHILTPHFPYRYRDDCTPRARPLDARGVAPEERVALYNTQVRCINELVLTAVDEIVERDPTAVILVQSDHGSDHTFTWLDDPEDWTPGQVTERYAAFNAMRLPADCDSDIEGQPLVNTFRIVFACIEGTEPDLLDYRAFAVPIEGVAEVIELTPDRFESPPP